MHKWEIKCVIEGKSNRNKHVVINNVITIKISRPVDNRYYDSLKDVSVTSSSSHHCILTALPLRDQLSLSAALFYPNFKKFLINKFSALSCRLLVPL